ncbi:MAG: AgmX/PglI C-terminal domain-containing protein [Myxococcales bacterium]
MGGKQGTLNHRRSSQPEATEHWRAAGRYHEAGEGSVAGEPKPSGTKVDQDFYSVFGAVTAQPAPVDNDFDSISGDVTAQPQPAAKPKTVYIPPAPGGGTGENETTVTLGVGGQKVVNIPGIARIAIGDPSVADVKPLGSTQVLIQGAQEGVTTLLVWKADGTRQTIKVDTRKADQRTASIPPATVETVSKAQLDQSDIMAVVVENKRMIKACVDEAKAKDPTATGTIVMRWTILPNGSVSNIQTKTEEYRKTPLAACLIAGIKKFKFPAYYGSQMPPVDFPFKF